MYDTLCLAGGGFRLVAKLGALSHDSNLYNYKTYVGVSMGAVVSLLLSIDYSLDEIYDYFTKQVLSYDRDVDLLSVHETYGLFSIERLYHQGLLPMLLKKLHSTNPTIGDIEQIFQKKLYICSWNLTENKLDYHTGDVPIKDAILMTTAIPFCLVSKKYQNNFHIDAGLLKGSLYIFNEMIEQGIISAETSVCYNLHVRESGKASHTNNIFDFIQQVMFVTVDSLMSQTKSKIKKMVVIKLSNTFPVLPIDVSEEKMKEMCEQMWNIGYNQIKKKN